jgi:predicted HTH domain antitoxin
MTEQYLAVLIDSLQKKCILLDKISELTELQSETIAEGTLSQEIMDFQKYDAYVNDKDVLVKELEKLDEGFDLVYRHIQKDLPQKKEQYAVQIRTLQQLISQIMDKSMSLQARESRNQQAVMQLIRKEKNKLGSQRRSNNAALNYYRNSSGLASLNPQFLDQKK